VPVKAGDTFTVYVLLRLLFLSRYLGEIKEFETANFLLIRPMISVLSTFSSEYMISTLFG
jgi:hypothetical protein